MPLKNLALLVIGLAVGWVWLKGLHLDDIQQILVQKTGVALTPVGSHVPGVNTPAAPNPGGPKFPAWTPGAGDTIKIATFNIRTFGNATAEKPHVYDTLATIIARFDIVAIQEIRTQDDLFLQKFVERIYQLTNRVYDYRIGPRLGNTRSTEQYAFVFDRARIQAHPTYMFTVTDNHNLLHREPFVGMFAVRGVDPNQRFTFALINVHTDPDVAGEEMNVLAQAYAEVARALQEDDILMLGDFNTDVPSALPSSLGRSSRPLLADDLFALGRIPGIYPVVQNEPTNTLRTKIHDNILFTLPATAEFTGRGGVYDIGSLHGLTQEQVGQISDHLPVWAEFSVLEANRPGHMAAGSAGAVR